MSRKFRLTLIGVSCVLLLLFAGFSYRVERGFLRDADFAVTVKLQERIDGSSRLRTSRVVSELLTDAVHAASPGASVLMILMLSLLWGIRKKRIRRNLILLPVAFFFLVIAESYGKSVVHHPAPPFFLIKNPVVSFPAYHVGEEYSYPSGHAGRAMFIATIAWAALMGYRRRVRVITAVVAGAFVLLVSVAVIYLGHHWMSDVLGGMLIAAALAIGFLATAAPIDGRHMNPYNTSTMIS